MSESWNYSKVVTLHSVALLGAFKQKQYRGIQFTNTTYKYFSRHPVYYVTQESELLSIASCVYISNKSARMLTDMYSSRVPVHVVVWVDIARPLSRAGLHGARVVAVHCAESARACAAVVAVRCSLFVGRWRGALFLLSLRVSATEIPLCSSHLGPRFVQ